MAKQQVSQLIQNTILTQLGSHRRVLVAYSGGIDSTVLLHALVTLKLEKLTSKDEFLTDFDSSIN